MSRDQRLVAVFLPVIAFSGWLVRKEYRENYGSPQSPSSAQLPSTPATASLKSNEQTTRASRGVATEEVAKNLAGEDLLVIERAKSAKASSLDATLPAQTLSEWMRETAGASARIVWLTSGCGELTRQEGVIPVCAEADVNFSDGTKFQSLLLMGTRDAKSQEIHYGDPSLLGAVYAKRGTDTLTPAPLSYLSRIAATAE